MSSEVEQSAACPKKWNFDVSSTAIIMYLDPVREHGGKGPRTSRCKVSKRFEGMCNERYGRG